MGVLLVTTPLTSTVWTTGNPHPPSLQAVSMNSHSPLPATVALAPGGLHIMLTGVRYRLSEGSSFPLTLTFEGAGSATIRVDVRSATARSGHAHDDEAD